MDEYVESGRSEVDFAAAVCPAVLKEDTGTAAHLFDHRIGKIISTRVSLRNPPAPVSFELAK